MTLETLLIHPAVQSLGWALLHFVWQGAVVAALLFPAYAMTRRSQARLRYAIGCVVMLLMPAVFVATIFRGELSLARLSPVQGSGVVVLSNADAASVEGAVPTSGGTVPLHSDGSSWYSTAVLPGWVVCLWLVGVAMLSMYTAGGWVRVRRLTQRGIEPAESAWILKLQSLMRRLHVLRPVRLYTSAIAQVPAVIGWVRPCILLPVSAIIGLDEVQLQAVLAHELAHIRRYDHLVNLLQSAVETLLFYHPAVWWISRKIREEREHCCDDLAVEACGDVMVYACALAKLEELRGSICGPVLAATGGDLLARIRRLVGEDVAGQGRIPESAGFTIAGALMLGALMVAGEKHWIRAQSPAAAPQAGFTQSAGAKPAFEVASVKITSSPERDPGSRFGSIQYSPDTLTLRKASMALMVRWAYGLGSIQISGPDWMQHPPPFYDIVAKASGPVRESQMRLMLRTLLGERFHLAVHWRKKEIPVTALLVAKGGPKFHKSDGKYYPERGLEAPLQFLGLDGKVHIQRILDQGHVRDSYTNIPMNDFATVLATWASKTPYDQAPVVNMTGLQGSFDFVIILDRPGSAKNEGGEESAPDDPLADMQRILPKQLGLVLERRKAMVDVLVVDRLDKEPTPN